MAEEIKDDNVLDKDTLSQNNKTENQNVKDDATTNQKDELASQTKRFDSAAGRIEGMQSKVDSQGIEISSLGEKLDQIIQTMRSPEPQQRSPEPDYTQEPDWMPTTKAELENWANDRDAVKAKMDQDYSNAYMATLNGLAKGEEKQVHEAILKEMTDNFNVRRSNNGAVDADLNYSKASRSYFKKQLGVKEKAANPLTGPDKGQPPLGGGLDGEKMRDKEVPMPTLDADAQAFIRDTGMKEDSVKKALTGEGLILRRKTG